MTKRKCLSIILFVVAVLCPFLFCLGLIGSLMREGGQRNWWQCLLGSLSPYNIWGAGLVGFASALTVLIINRKQLKTVFAWFGLLLLLLVNSGLILPISAFVSTINRTYQYPHPTVFDRADVSDEDLARLEGNRYIKEIRFHSCSTITDNVVRSLARIPRLKKIVLSENPQLKDLDFSRLGNLKKLDALTLYNNGDISAESLGTVAVLSRLKELDLSGCSQADDEVLSKIAVLKNLRRLELKECEKITDAGIAELLQLRHLEFLSIQGCPSVTPEGVRRVRNELPKCEIDWKDRPAGN
jgi:hypothetical protein